MDRRRSKAPRHRRAVSPHDLAGPHAHHRGDGVSGKRLDGRTAGVAWMVDRQSPVDLQRGASAASAILARYGVSAAAQGWDEAVRYGSRRPHRLLRTRALLHAATRKRDL